MSVHQVMELSFCGQFTVLESRGPGVDPFRASEMGTKMAEKWILALPEKWGKHGPENGKNGPKFHFRTISGPLFPFSGPFFSFSTIFLPFSGEAKIHVSAIFVPISGLRPEMDLYQVHGIPITVSQIASDLQLAI